MSWQQTILRSAGIAALSLTAVVGTASADDLVVTGPGGNTGKQWQEIVYDPFTQATGNTITVVPLGGDETLAKAIAEVDAPSIDIFQFPGGQETEAVKRDVTLGVGDVSATGIKPDFLGPDGKWVGVFATLNGVLYNTQHVTAPPTSVMDLLKPEYAGHVAIPAMTSAKGPALLVTLAKANGGDENNVEPGMKLLGELLKNGAKVFSKASQLQSMLAQDEAWIVYYDANNALTAKKNGLPIEFAPPKEGMWGSLTTVAIAKNTAKPDAARALVAFMLKQDVQQAMADQMVSFPAVEGASMPQDVLDELHITADDIANIMHVDSAAVASNRAGWIDDFNRLAVQ